MTKTARDILCDLIKRYEGCRLQAYEDCGKGIYTIGYGVTGKDIIKGLVWTQQQADEALINLSENTIITALQSSPILKSQSESKKAAIADFIYNCGLGNYNSSTLKKKIDSARWDEAIIEIKKWNKGGGKVLQGLVTRRQKEADLLLI